MERRTIASYGSWRSIIAADLAVAAARRLAGTWIDGDAVYWSEGRPEEGGRVVVVRRDRSGALADLTPTEVNVRTRVHEYGGGAFLVAEGTLYCSDFSDGRVWAFREGEPPRPLTSVHMQQRFADFRLDAIGRRLIAVCEDHSPRFDAASGVQAREPVNTIVAIPLDGSARLETLVGGADFYSHPRLNPDGTRLAWLSWNHPDMPWDQTSLWVAEIMEDGSLDEIVEVAGAPGESICQPEWSPDGVLYFVSDRNGWWNLYRWIEGGEDGVPAIEAVWQDEAELGLPQWVFGQSQYTFISAGRAVIAPIRQGQASLGILDLRSGAVTPIVTPFTDIGDVRASEGRIVAIAGGPTEPAQVVEWRVDPEGRVGPMAVLRRSSDTVLDPAWIARPETIEFPTAGGGRAWGFYYAPTNPEYEAPFGETPPLRVISHGGPTSAAGTTLSLGLQYWTSRGFAVIDVNYRGSSGYGKAYRRLLEGQWGIADVQDVCAAVDYLVAEGRVDPARVVIQGGSAGGYTTLAALAFTSTFKAGASYYGVGDLEALARDTHKFESRYLDRLVAPYPQGRDVYVARSPIHHVDRISAPLILFQGLDDRIVPPNQAEMTVAALRARGLPVAYVAFEGEGHGFRKGENIKRCLEAELSFYSQIFGFDLADPIPAVPVENLPGAG